MGDLILSTCVKAKQDHMPRNISEHVPLASHICGLLTGKCNSLQEDPITLARKAV